MLQNLRIRFACNIDQLYCNIKSIKNGVDYDIGVSYSFLDQSFQIFSPPSYPIPAAFIYIYICVASWWNQTQNIFVKIVINAFQLEDTFMVIFKKLFKKNKNCQNGERNSYVRRWRNPCFEIWTFEVIEYISIATAMLKLGYGNTTLPCYRVYIYCTPKVTLHRFILIYSQYGKCLKIFVWYILKIQTFPFS